MYRVAFDLSTKKTGVCFYNVNNKIIKTFVVDLGGFDKLKWYEAMVTFKNVFLQFTKFIIEIEAQQPIQSPLINIECFCELSTFSDLNSQRFHYYAGILFSVFTIFKFDTAFNGLEVKKDIKFFTANEWFKHFAFLNGVSVSLTRKERKAESLKFLKSFVDVKSTFTEDEADAFCIAYFGNMCRDNSEIHDEVLATKHAKSTLNKERKKRINKLNNRLKTIAKHKSELLSKEKLTPKQKEKLDALNKELEAINGELKTI